MLDVFTGQLERMADSYEDFIREVNEQWWHEAQTAKIMAGATNIK